MNRRVKSLKVTMIHRILQHYKMYSICREQSEKCLNCVLCFVRGQTNTSAHDSTQLELSCIKILPTFKLTKHVLTSLTDASKAFLCNKHRGSI